MTHALQDNTFISVIKKSVVAHRTFNSAVRRIKSDTMSKAGKVYTIDTKVFNDNQEKLWELLKTLKPSLIFKRSKKS